MSATVRYLVGDVDRSVSFYVDRFGFRLGQRMGPAFARVARDGLELWLAGPVDDPDGNPVELFEARR